MIRLRSQLRHRVVTGGVLPVTTLFRGFRHSAGSTTTAVTSVGDETISDVSDDVAKALHQSELMVPAVCAHHRALPHLNDR